MNLTGAIVLYAVIWFMTFYIVLPIRIRRTQADEGSVVPGTPAGAPAREEVGKVAKLTTLVATLLWLAVAGVILSGWIGIDDMDVLNIMGWNPPPG